MNEVELERMIVRLIGDSTSFNSMMKQAQAINTETEAKFKSTGNAINSVTNTLKGYAHQAMSYATTAIGGFGLLSSVAKGINLAAQYEQNETSFSVMLGSMEKGKFLMQELATFAAKTPLNLSEIQSATRLLLQFGVAGNNIIPTLTMLGDVTGGDAQRFQSMALAYGQMQSAGKLMGQDLLQMINAGFNPLQIISEKTGESISSLRSKMEKGQITVQMVEKALKDATGAGGKFENLMQKQSRTLSGLFSTMQDDISAFLRNIGMLVVEAFKLKDVIQLISSTAQKATEFFNSLSSTTKNAIIIVSSLALAIGSLYILWPMISAAALPVIKLIGAALATLVSPIGLIVALIGVLTYAGVQQLGGFAKAWETVSTYASNAWDYIKTKGSEFLTWIKPVTDALSSFFSAAWEKIKEGANAVINHLYLAWEGFKITVSTIFNAISGSSSITWNEIRDGIRDAILFAEFTLNNFGQVAELVWLSTKLGFVRFINTLTFTFTDTIPYLLGYFQRNWKEIFVQLVSNTATLIENLATNIVNVFKNIPELLAGTVDWSDVWKPLQEGFVDIIQEDLKLPERQKSTLEQNLEVDVDKALTEVGKSFDQFRKDKLKSFDVVPEEDEFFEEEERKAVDLGSRVGKAANTALKNEIGKFDAILLNSVEGLARLIEFEEKLNRQKEETKRGLGTSPNATVPRIDPTLVNSSESLAKADRQIEVLKEIREAVKTSNNKPTTELQPANL